MNRETQELKYQLSEIVREISNSVSAAKDCTRMSMGDDAQLLMDRVLRLNAKRRVLVRQLAAATGAPGGTLQGTR